MGQLFTDGQWQSEKLQLELEAVCIVTGLTTYIVYSSRDSLYQGTGWEKLSSRWESRFIREDASQFLLNCQLYIEHRTVLFNILHHREILGQGWIIHDLLTLKTPLRMC